MCEILSDTVTGKDFLSIKPMGKIHMKKVDTCDRHKTLKFYNNIHSNEYCRVPNANVNSKKDDRP